MEIRKVGAYLGSAKIEVKMWEKFFPKDIEGVVLPREIVHLKPGEFLEIPDEFVISNMDITEYKLFPEELSDKTFIKIVCNFYHFDGEGNLKRILREQSHCM